MFCKDCGTKFLAAFCNKCGKAKQEALPQVAFNLAQDKFCNGCGKPVNAAYCAGCGKYKNSELKFGKSRIATSYVPSEGAQANLGGIAASVSVVDLVLMGIAILFALTTMNWFSGLMLVAAVAPIALSVINPQLYAKIKLPAVLASGGLAFVFAILATFTMRLRLHPFALFLCLVGIVALVILGIGSQIGIKLPPKLQEIAESPLLLFLATAYFAIVTSIMRVSVRLWLMGPRFINNFGPFRTFLLLLFTIILLAPIIVLAFARYKNFLADKIHFLLIALAGSSLLGLFIFPFYMRWRVGTPILFMLLGFAGIAAAGYLLFLYKDLVIDALQGKPVQSNFYAPHMPVEYSSAQPAYIAPAQSQQMAHTPPPGSHVATGPHGPMLKTDRSLLLFILLSMVTFGIYGIIQMSRVSTDINTIASRFDHKNTMHFCLVVFLLGPITFGIFTIIWFHMLSERIGMELKRRDIAYPFDVSAYWLWWWVGSLLFGIGPFVYMYKMFQAMNLLSADYNSRG